MRACRREMEAKVDILGCHSFQQTSSTQASRRDRQKLGGVVLNTYCKANWCLFDVVQRSTLLVVLRLASMLSLRVDGHHVAHMHGPLY